MRKIDATKAVINSLSAIITEGVKYFKDGIQVTDLSYLPIAVRHTYNIVKLMPEVTQEMMDLDGEEVVELMQTIVVKILEVLNKR